MPQPDRPGRPRDDDERHAVVVNNHYHPDPALAELLREVLLKVDQVLVNQNNQGVTLMSIQTDLQAARAELATANETTNEIAADLADLVQKLADAPANSAEAAALLSEAQALTARLRGVADTHTTDAPAPPAEPA